MIDATGEYVLERWRDFVISRDPSLLEALIAEEAVFLSPAVHRPQEGRALVVRYLSAAMEVLGNDRFHYLGEWRRERSAVLEFETWLDDVYVNGVDMFDWDSDGRIVLFKVMVRPKKGLERLIALMGPALERLAG